VPTTQDILSDIEFELAQGAVLSDELSQAVQAVRQYQNKLRGELFGTSQKLDRQAVARLFQVNDMLITVLQEMATTWHAAQLDQRRRAKPDLTTESAASMALDSGRDPRELERVMHPDAIRVDLHARLLQVPLIGWLIGRIQVFLHRPALYYTTLFADRQVVVNRTLGDWTLALHEQQALHAAELARLHTRIAALETRLASQREPE